MPGYCIPQSCGTGVPIFIGIKSGSCHILLKRPPAYAVKAFLFGVRSMETGNYTVFFKRLHAQQEGVSFLIGYRGRLTLAINPCP